MSVNSIQSTDLDSFWQQHARELRARCLAWMGGQPDDAQEAFSRAWARAAATLIERRAAPADAHAWMLTLTYRVCMDIHRERRRRAEEALESDAEAIGPIALVGPSDPERSALGKELSSFLKDSIRQLPPRLRDAMRIYITSGDYGDIAARFGITGANARKRIQQARAILRARLGDYRGGRTAQPRCGAVSGAGAAVGGRPLRVFDGVHRSSDNVPAHVPLPVPSPRLPLVL